MSAFPTVDVIQEQGLEFRLRQKFDANLAQLCKFYGVSASALDEGEVFRQASKAIGADPEISDELAVVRAALNTLNSVGEPEIDFVSESQDKVLALRVFFGLAKELVADVLELPVSHVQACEDLSIAGLQQRIDSGSQRPVVDDDTAEFPIVEVEQTTAELEMSAWFSNVVDDLGREAAEAKPAKADIGTPDSAYQSADFDVADLEYGVANFSHTEEFDVEEPSVVPAVDQEAVPVYSHEKEFQEDVFQEDTSSKSRGALLVLFGVVAIAAIASYWGFVTSDWALGNSAEIDPTPNKPQLESDASFVLPDDAGQAPSAQAGAGVVVSEDADTETETGTEAETGTEVETETGTEPAAPNPPEQPTPPAAAPFAQPVSVNGSFEAGVPAGSFRNLSAIQGWTGSQGIEIWGDGHSGVRSPAGNNFVELNSTGRNEMVTQVRVSPNSQLEWSLRHRGRDGTDTMLVTFESESGEQQAWRVESPQQWRTYEFDYVVPADSNNITVKLISITRGSRGNLIDDFKISLKP